jgi:hypothetical protein
MNSRKHKRYNGLNKNRKGLIDGYTTIDDDSHRNTINMHQSSTFFIEETSVSTRNNIEQFQIIKLNGKLYVPVQRELLLYGNKIKKHVHSEDMYSLF